MNKIDLLLNADGTINYTSMKPEYSTNTDFNCGEIKYNEKTENSKAKAKKKIFKLVCVLFIILLYCHSRRPGKTSYCKN